MARVPRPAIDLEPAGDDPGFSDDLTEQDLEQSQVGDLFTIQGPEFENISWSIFRFRTRAEMSADTQGQAEEWVAGHTGEIHGADVAEILGGGTFRFRGYRQRSDGRGVRLAYNRTIAIAGLRKNFSAPPAAPAVIAPPPQANGGTDPALLRLLERMELRLSMIERTPTTSPPGPTIKDLADTLLTLNSLNQRAQPASDSSLAKELFNSMTTAMQTGIELGQAREPVPAAEGAGATDWLKVAETFVPLAMRVLDRAGQPRPAAPRPVEHGPVAPPPPSGSHAEVVDEPITVPPIMAARMMVVVDLLAMGATNQDPIDEVADTVAEILPVGDLEGILRIPDQAVVDDIASRSAGQYPILASDAGKNYVAAVLAELRRPPADDAPDGA